MSESVGFMKQGMSAMDAVNASKGATVNSRNPYQLQIVVVKNRSETFARPYSRTSCQLISVMNAMGTFSVSVHPQVHPHLVACWLQRHFGFSLKPISLDAA